MRLLKTIFPQYGQLRLVNCAFFMLMFCPALTLAELDIDTPIEIDQTAADSDYDNALDSQTRRKSLADHQTPDLWERVRRGFGLTGYQQRRVDAELRWYANHPDYINRVVDRATPFLYFIMTEIERRGLPAEIALLPVVESAFQPFAFSAGQAAGMWQFIPATGNRYGLKINWWYDGRRDAIISTIAALNFLEDLYTHFDSDWLLALAAYNTGQGNIDRAIRKNIETGKPRDFWSLNLPKETRDYVPKLLAIATAVSNPTAFALTLAPIPDRPYLKSIQLDSQFDMAWVANMADIKIDELLALNAAFNRWASPPNGPHRIILPIGPAETFTTKLAELGPVPRQRWSKHDIADGDNLAGIARKYRTNPQLIKQVNKLNPNKPLARGDSLLVPDPDAGGYSIPKTATGKTDDAKPIEHVVRAGDSFSKIADQYRVSVSDLANWNQMSANDILVAGKKLVVWARHLGQSILQNPMMTEVTKTTTRTISYRVKHGDSLATIAAKFNVSRADLIRWNRLKSDAIVRPGSELQIEVDLTDQGG